MTTQQTIPTPSTTPVGSRDQPGAEPFIVLVGNPNVGKTTIFNQLTGENARIGNYPGITVERRVGTMQLPAAESRRASIQLVNAPGAYSLSARSSDGKSRSTQRLACMTTPNPRWSWSSWTRGS